MSSSNFRHFESLLRLQGVWPPASSRLHCNHEKWRSSLSLLFLSEPPRSLPDLARVLVIQTGFSSTHTSWNLQVAPTCWRLDLLPILPTQGMPAPESILRPPGQKEPRENITLFSGSYHPISHCRVILALTLLLSLHNLNLFLISACYRLVLCLRTIPSAALSVHLCPSTTGLC